MRTLLRRILSVIAMVVAIAAITAVPSSAAAPPSNCPKGYFCVYSDVNMTGSLMYKSAGNWSGTISNPGSLVNNGYYYPGYDHIQVSWLDHGSFRTRCIHYYPEDTPYYMNFGTYATLYNVTWRGGC